MSLADEPEVRLVSRDGALHTLVRWIAERRGVGAADVAAERDRVLARYADMDPVSRQRFVAPRISDERPVADRFPTLSSLEFGRDGRLWVKRYPRPRDESRNRWMVFAPDGALLCHVTLPEELEVYDVGADYVLGRLRDALGVERVLLYELSAG